MSTRVASTIWLCAMLISVCLSFRAYAVSLDGIIEVPEWQNGSEYTVVGLRDESNCDIDYARMRVTIDDDNCRIYIALKCGVSMLDEQNELYGVSFTVNSGSTVSAFADSTENICDTELYSIDAAFSLYPVTKELHAEAYVGVKFGVPQTLTLGVRVYDFYGSPTNYYTFLIRSQAQNINTEELEEAHKQATTRGSTDNCAASQSTRTTKKATEKASSLDVKPQYTTVPYVPAVLFLSTTTEPQAATQVQNSTTSKRGNSQTAAQKTEVETKKETSANCEYEVGFTTDAEVQAELSETCSENVAASEIVLSQDDSGNGTKTKKILGISLSALLLLGALVFIFKSTLAEPTEREKYLISSEQQ